MKIDIIHSLSNAFESHAQQIESGVEFWLTRDLQHLLGGSEWRNFTNPLRKGTFRPYLRAYWRQRTTGPLPN